MTAALSDRCLPAQAASHLNKNGETLDSLLKLENALNAESSLLKHSFCFAVSAGLSFVVCHPASGSYPIADWRLIPMEDADFLVHAPSEGRKAYNGRVELVTGISIRRSCVELRKLDCRMYSRAFAVLPCYREASARSRPMRISRPD
ncbi:hypothetical protein KC348_g21 [Hortaea werneckii]|nr:hypothetical protein KC348_g21 [Hortaea werneckii]